MLGSVSVKELLLVIAFVFFVMAGFNVPSKNWMCFGFAAVTLALTV